MSKSESGRVVIDIEPALKRRLYSVLAIDSMTLKDWFITTAELYVKNHSEKPKKAKAKK